MLASTCHLYIPWPITGCLNTESEIATYHSGFMHSKWTPFPFTQRRNIWVFILVCHLSWWKRSDEPSIRGNNTNLCWGFRNLASSWYVITMNVQKYYVIFRRAALQDVLNVPQLFISGATNILAPQHSCWFYLSAVTTFVDFPLKGAQNNTTTHITTVISFLSFPNLLLPKSSKKTGDTVSEMFRTPQ